MIASAGAVCEGEAGPHGRTARDGRAVGAWGRALLHQTAAFALALAYGGGLWLHLLHEVEGATEQVGVPGLAPLPASLLHWLRDATLALPLVWVAAWAGLLLGQRLLARYAPGASQRATGAVVAATVAVAASAMVAAATPLHGLLFEAHHGGHELPLLAHIVRDGLLALVANLAIASAVAAGRIGGAGVSARPWPDGADGRAETPAPPGPPRGHRGPRRQPSGNGRGSPPWLPPHYEPPVDCRLPTGNARLLRLDARLITVGIATALFVAILRATLLLLLPQPLAEPANAASVRCSVDSPDRSYHVVAITVAIPFNRWGQVLPRGQVYALDGDKEAVRNWSLPLNAEPAQDPAGNRRLRPRPLVLRANASECVKVTFTNELDANPEQEEGFPSNPRASIHVHGASYNAYSSDGSMVGYNEDTTVPNGGGTVTYLWQAPQQEGLYFFHDHAVPAGTEHDAGATGLGLFGALAVEPAGSTWLDASSGAPLYTGTTAQSGELYLDAIIQPPSAPSFRESIQLGWDEIPSIGLGFNYGSEPLAMRADPANRCPDCVGEETWLSSWPYGDPSLIKLASGPGPWKPTPGNTNVEDCGLPVSCYVSNVTHAYKGDPIKIRFGMAGTKETHVFHLHAHQWRAEPNDPNSTTIDSQTMGPGEMFTADLLFSAGSKPGTVGDSIFHCHLYPHFAEGFWSLLRVHDVLEDGSQPTPDGVNVRPVHPLSDRPAPVAPTPDNPGYPRFMPGQFGWRAPQPPGGITEGGPLGPAAPRTVAGKLVDPARVAIEQGVQQRTYKGATPKPGAPLVDPCPAGAREVTYNVSVIQRDVVYNEAGWHDTQGRFLVLDQDVDAVLAGTKAPEPFFLRVNAGDCVNYNLTNRLPNWVGGDAFLKIIQTNMVGEHIHLVKFDVTASDGASNGWNYQQAAFTTDQANFNAQVLAGTKTCTSDEALGACRLPDPTTWNPTWSGNPVGQTIHERWYADYELRTIFTHDHHFPAEDQNRGLFGGLIVEPAGMDMRDSHTGAYKQPVNDSAHGTVCAAACEGTAAGTYMDLIGRGAHDDFREFALAFQDFVSLTRPGGDPRLREGTLNPPLAPEEYPDDDPGIMAINFRNAPLLLRESKNGVRIDPAYRFSSTVFGDPQTPLLQAYAGDPVRIRLIQGAQEEQHVFNLHGMRWRQEPDDPNSPLANSVALGISEAFNFEIPKMECGVDDDCQGDYLYSSAGMDDIYLGMWGLFRVYGKSLPSLLPLPDNTQQALSGTTNFDVTGKPPRPANKPGTPCPDTAPLRQYQVVALEAPLTYNEAGDNDPYGLIYALVEPGETPDQAVARARQKPEPLVLRANAGDCLEITLTNQLTPSFLNHAGAADGDAMAPLEPATGTPAGLRVSLHPQLLRYDVRGSDGATVGFNRDQTVGPGGSLLYRWYADEVSPGELGAVNLVDFGDRRGHRHHGLFAGLVVEPKGATYHDPLSGAEIRSGVSADIRVPGRKDFREFALFFQDGLNLRDQSGAIIADPKAHPAAPGEVAEPLDPEDQGEKGFNYANAPFSRRLGYDPAADRPLLSAEAWAHVFSSTAHNDFNLRPYGDPRTPILRAYAGDAVRFRVLQGGDKPRQHSFQVSGHAWMAQPDDPGSSLIATQGGMSVMRALNVELPSAGGTQAYPGDYRYNCGVSFHHLSGGLWGIMRVYEAPQLSAAFQPGALKELDDPHQPNYYPLMPLDLPELTASVFDDGNMNAARGTGEAGVPQVAANLRATDGTILDTKTTGVDGRVTFLAPPGVYDLEVVVPPDWAATMPTTYRVDATSDGQFTGEFGLVQLADVAVRVFDDKNGNGLLEDGESGLAGWTVTLAGGGATLTATTSADGMAAFDSLKPGSYTASVTAQPLWLATRKLPASISVAENASLQPPNDVRIGYVLEAGLSAKLFNDSNGNNVQDAGESSLAGWEVTAAGGPAESPVTVTAVTDSTGVARFDDPDPNIDGLRPGSYKLSAKLPPDWTCFNAWSTTTVPDGPTTTTAPASCADGSYTTVLVDQTAQLATMAYRNPNVWVVAVPFNDVNNDGTRQDKESKLVGWTASLFQADGATPAVPTGAASNTALTGNDGRAVFYPLPAGTYVAKMVPPPPSPDPTVLNWTATSPGQVSASVIAGETGTASFGFVQLGTVGAVVFNDLDRDGVWDDNEGPLANRNVRLYDKTGKTVLAQGIADAGGRFAFKVSVGQEYQLEVLLPTGWSATAPAGTNGTPTTRVKVSGPSGTTSAEVQYGQYALNDTTPPPSPVASPPGGTYTASQSVSLASETGATIRYTLDGSTPSATAGTVYSGPITIASSMTLKAVAIDPAGNVSSLTTEVYTFSNDTTPPPAPTATPPGGNYPSAQSVTLTSEAGATIRYTLDGSTPTKTTGTVYSEPIAIASSLTLKAVTIDAAGNVSTVATESYKISKDTTPPPAPQAAPPGGTYTAPQSVTLTSEPGATIRYTLDGSIPSKRSGTVYSGPIAIASSLTLKAIAIDAAGNVSAVTTEVYTINPGPTPTPTATSNVTATPTATATATPTPAPATPTPTPKITGKKATPTPTPTSAGVAVAAASPTPTATPTATPTLGSTATSVPTPTATSAPPTPTPTSGVRSARKG